MSLIPDKKVKSILITEKSVLTLIQTDNAIAILNIIISKEKKGRLILSANDGEDIPILFVEDKGTTHFKPEGGLNLWRGANLVANNESDGKTLIFIDYIDIHGSNKTTWEVK